QIPNNGYSEYTSNGYYYLCQQAGNVTRHIRVTVGNNLNKNSNNKNYIMKNYITLGLLCLFSNLIFSQITLEHSYTGNSQLLYSGYKFSFNTENDIYFYTYDSSSNSIDIYNSSHTLYKTVSLPFTNTAYLSIFFPTDKLFNNDNLIEFIAMAYSNSGTSSMQLINEDGTVLYDFGDKN